eukprot:2396595-Heterocapsa_arctica.AAC.1
MRGHEPAKCQVVAAKRHIADDTMSACTRTVCVQSAYAPGCAVAAAVAVPVESLGCLGLHADTGSG